MDENHLCTGCGAETGEAVFVMGTVLHVDDGFANLIDDEFEDRYHFCDPCANRISPELARMFPAIAAQEARLDELLAADGMEGLQAV